MDLRLSTRALKNSKGFTIVELMVATVVFGVVLLLVATAILQFSRVYYKGITESTLQNTARNVVDTIAQGIQFNGGNVTTTPASMSPGSSYAICVGNQRYSFTTGTMLSDSPATGQSRHVLVVDNVAGCNSSTAPQSLNTTSINGRELLSPRMRLARFSVTSVGDNLYKVSVRVVYGEDDLLTDPTAEDATCKNVRAGTQFCAFSDITTNVVKRVE